MIETYRGVITLWIFTVFNFSMIAIFPAANLRRTFSCSSRKKGLWHRLNKETQKLTYNGKREISSGVCRFKI